MVLKKWVWATPNLRHHTTVTRVLTLAGARFSLKSFFVPVYCATDTLRRIICASGLEDIFMYFFAPFPWCERDARNDPPFLVVSMMVTLESTRFTIMLVIQLYILSIRGLDA